MSGDADLNDAAFLQYSGFEDVHGAGEFADRPRRVARDQQNMFDASGAQIRKPPLQGLSVRDTPYRDVGRCEKPRALRRERGTDHIGESGIRRVRHVDRGTPGKEGCEFRQAVLLRGRDFGGSPPHESHDPTFQVVHRRQSTTQLTGLGYRYPVREWAPNITGAWGLPHPAMAAGVSVRLCTLEESVEPQCTS